MEPQTVTNLLAWATSLAGGATIALAVVALFGHGGHAQVSAQRRFTVAAGHADRQTVFESPLLSPLMWLLVRLMEALNLPRAKQRLHEVLICAGSPRFYTAEEYLALAALWGIGRVWRWGY